MKHMSFARLGAHFEGHDALTKVPTVFVKVRRDFMNYSQVGKTNIDPHTTL